jgi:hypothetical protein
MKKLSAIAAVGFGSIAISYFYGQSLISLVAAAISATASFLSAAYALSMGLVALSAFPSIVIGLAVAFVCYNIMKGSIKFYNSWTQPIGDDGNVIVMPQAQSYKYHQIAIAAIILGLVAAVACKLFFAAIVLGVASAIPALIAAVTSYTIVSTMLAGISSVLSATILPTVLAYITVGSISAYVTKSFLDWCAAACDAQELRVMPEDSCSGEGLPLALESVAPSINNAALGAAVPILSLDCTPPVSSTPPIAVRVEESLEELKSRGAAVAVRGDNPVLLSPIDLSQLPAVPEVTYSGK